MQYNLTHEPSTDPGLVAAAEQQNAAIYEAERLTDRRNDEMVEDPCLDDLIRWNLHGQPTPLREFDAYMPGSDGLVAPHVAVVVAAPVGYPADALAHEVPEDGGPVTRARAASCVRCGNPKHVTADYRVFWVACGRVILEVVVCAEHARFYTDWFGAVPKEVPVGTV